MNNLMQDALSKISLDFKSYGDLPPSKELYLATRHIRDKEQNEKIIEQYDKLQYMRQHLFVIDEYLHSNKGEALKVWLAANQKGLSHKVLEKIGEFNNQTKGISVYFLNLQELYDKEEEIYDGLEENKEIPEDYSRAFKRMAESRKEKRKDRREARKLQFKEISKEEAGFVVYTLDDEKPEPPKQEAKEEPKPETPKEEKVEAKEEKKAEKKSNGKEYNKTEEQKEKEVEQFAADAQPEKKYEAKVIDNKKNLFIPIAGFIIVVSLIALAATAKKK